MSVSVNKVTLIGNLGRDPESKGKGDTPIAMLTIATSRQWKDRVTGAPREETEWHRVVAYQGLAKIVLDYAKKGRQVYVEGFLRTRKWTDAQGADHYATEIVAEVVQLLGSNPNAQAPAAARAQTPQQSAPARAQPSSAPSTPAAAPAPDTTPPAAAPAAAPAASIAEPNPAPIAAPAAPAHAAPAQLGLLDEDNDIPF